MECRRSIATRYIEKGSSKEKVIQFSQLETSTFYYKKNSSNAVIKTGRHAPGFSYNVLGAIVPDAFIINLLKAYRSKIEFANGGGYKALSKYLKNDYGIIINKKKVYRLCRENKLLLPKRKKQKRFRKICNNHSVNRPNQLWQFDIKYGYINGTNQPFFLLGFVDVFTKKVVGHHVGLNCKAEDLKFTLNFALNNISDEERSSLTIRSDNGPQMSSNEFKKFVDANTINHEFTPIQCPNKNAFIESFFSIYEIEFLQVRYLNNFAEAYIQTNEWIDWYNNFRLHGSLNYNSPKKFIEKFEAKEIEIITVSA